jgi:phosphopentomutase
MPTFPSGFPTELIRALEKETGLRFLCNLPYSGTDVIRDYGEEHLASGSPILYTSADSVLQLAVHTSVMPCEELYALCRTARRLCTGKYAVGRIIARPFTGEPGHFVRTPDRRDFSLPPSGETLLDRLSASGLSVISVGKISDIFAGRGITESYPDHGNPDCISRLLSLAKREFSGLCFVNLVDFDTLFGHRNDAVGYARALGDFDRALGELIPLLGEEDALLITADHGCDPSDASTDHTRERVPLLVYGKRLPTVRFGAELGFASVAQTVAELLGIEASYPSPSVFGGGFDSIKEKM